MRTSYGVSEYMQSQGYRIMPVNPLIAEVAGREGVCHTVRRAGEDRYRQRVSAIGVCAGSGGRGNPAGGSGDLDAGRRGARGSCGKGAGGGDIRGDGSVHIEGSSAVGEIRVTFTTETRNARRNRARSGRRSAIRSHAQSSGVKLVGFVFQTSYFSVSLCLCGELPLSFLISSRRALMRFSMPSSVGW